MAVMSIERKKPISWGWNVDPALLETGADKVKSALLDLGKPLFLAEADGQIGVADATVAAQGSPVLAFAQTLLPEEIGRAHV